MILGPRTGWLAMLAACALPALAQLVPPSPPSTPTSRELAAQAPPVGGRYAYRHKLAQYVKDKRADVLQAHFEERLAAQGRGELGDAVTDHMFAMVARADEADAGLFDQWTDGYPQSFIGPLARAHFRLHRAWKARGNQYAHETSASQFAEMERWLPLARHDAQLALQRVPSCGLCYTLLIRLSMPMRLKQEALGWLNQALTIDPGSVAAPLTYFESLDARWRGSDDAQDAFVRKLELAGHQGAAARLRAEQATARIDHRRWNGPRDAASGLDAARQALAIADTFDGRYIEAYALQELDRHAEALDAFDRIVERYDSPAEVYTHRAAVYAALERWPEAVRDLRIAYDDFGSSWAFEMLARLSFGNSGWKLRTRDTEAGELCREGALRGLPVAMTCLGGLHFFGTGGVARDIAEARRWFTRAADAGEPQGMMDLAQMCLNGHGGPVDRDQAIRWWLRAASLDYPRARAKLDHELSLWERVRYVHWPELSQRAGGLLQWGLMVLDILLRR